MLPSAVTAEAPTACGGGGTPGQASARDNGIRLWICPAQTLESLAVKKPAAREAAATSAATAIVEVVRTAETTQVDSGATALLQQ